MKGEWRIDDVMEYFGEYMGDIALRVERSQKYSREEIAAMLMVEVEDRMVSRGLSNRGYQSLMREVREALKQLGYDVPFASYRRAKK